MELEKVIEERYSCRSFTDKVVEEEKLKQILRAGQLAPTACNNQPQKVLVINNNQSLEKWRKCTSCHFNEQLVLVTCYDEKLSWKRSFDNQDSGFVDGTIVATHMMLEAKNLGIDSTWIMYFDPQALKEEFDIPNGIIPVSALAMGYASSDVVVSPKHNERKDLTETIVYDKF